MQFMHSPATHVVNLLIYALLNNLFYPKIRNLLINYGYYVIMFIDFILCKFQVIISHVTQYRLLAAWFKCITILLQRQAEQTVSKIMRHENCGLFFVTSQYSLLGNGAKVLLRY